jgi:2-keto-4-pentenoate hydratase/2-oxohepta-3-ene-1,7-dioic acid hydratase in catechol pathway
MKIVRFQITDDGSVYYGELKNNTIYEIINFSFQQRNYNFGRIFPITDIKLLAPVTPEKVVGLAYNYKDLVGEKEIYDEPLIFLKSPESVIGPNDFIRIHQGWKTWAEVELAIIIGKECSNVSIETAAEYIYGYTIGNDVTMINVNERDHHLARSKALDTFCPLGQYIDTSLITDNLSLQHYINGTLFQKGNTNNRILNNVESVSFVSQFIRLKPGDIILTGTPANAMNSVITHGDNILMEITGLGILSNQVHFK